jgi:hypothetical protein
MSFLPTFWLNDMMKAQMPVSSSSWVNWESLATQQGVSKREGQNMNARLVDGMPSQHLLALPCIGHTTLPGCFPTSPKTFQTTLDFSSSVLPIWNIVLSTLFHLLLCWSKSNFPLPVPEVWIKVFLPLHSQSTLSDSFLRALSIFTLHYY